MPMIRTYRKRLEIVIQTQDRVAFEERPHFVAGLLFLALGLMMIVLTFRGHPVGPTAIVVGIVVGTALCVLGLLALVRTTISAVRQPGILEIRRQLGPAIMNRLYPFADVVRVFERRTRKGNGLRVELVDGHKKNLTLWTEYVSLSKEVGVLNHFVHRGRMDDLEERVVVFAGEWFRRNFRIGSPLSFAIDGVDATRFFEEFEVEFKVDLNPLREFWSLHFPPRHGPYFAWIVVVVLSYFLGSYLHQLVRWCPTLIWTLMLATASDGFIGGLFPRRPFQSLSTILSMRLGGAVVRQYDDRPV